MNPHSVGRPNSRSDLKGRTHDLRPLLKRRPAMGGIASVLYGVLSYLLFFGTFLYAVAFVGNLPVPGLLVPKTIDSGAAGPLVTALIVNIHLLALFAIQHSVMARP